MTIGFIVTSYWAFGELLIAQYFARQVAAAGYTPYFIIPPTHEKVLKESGYKYTLLFPKMAKINRILLQDFQHRYRPGLVILSDFINFHFCEKHYGLTREDLDIFEGRLGTFDNFHWKLEKREMDTYGFRAREVSNVDIDNYGFRLLPCPIVNPAPDRPEIGEYYYPLNEDYIEYDETSKKKLRTELSLPLDKPIGLVTSAAWQSTYRQYPHVKTFVRKSGNTFMDILKTTFKNGVIIYVGKNPGFESNNGARFIHFDRLNPLEFEKYAMASDIYISKNVSSTTLARFSLSGLPTAVLINSKQTVDGLDKSAHYPFRMFPVGWFKFLKPVLKDNPYARLVNEMEIFDERETVEKLKSLIHKKTTREECKNRALRFRKRLAPLMKPGEIVETLIGRRK
jgi:hypothetical protein